MINDVTTIEQPVEACTGGLLSDLEQGAWLGFLRTHATLTRQLDEELTTRHGLPLSSYDVLVQLGSAPDRRLRMSELADAVLLSRSGLTRLVGRLVDQGLIERVGCERDARGAYAVLTDLGEERLAEARVTHLAGIRERFLDRLDDREKQQLGAAWARLAG